MDFDERDVLLKAAERVSEEGMWCQKTMYATWVLDTGAMIEATNFSLTHHNVPIGAKYRVPECAVGAIQSAAYLLAGENDHATLARLARNRLSAWLIENRKHSEGSIPGWNDRSRRTAFEVAEAMRKAAE